ncbi:hypothetical protein [Leptospira weilii]|nr:hypothetical protein [Leptospira weilii]MCL8268399.1 hypothetical protein [Leptospira weilii]
MKKTFPYAFSEDLEDCLAQMVIPIFVKNGNRVELRGTGFLIKHLGIDYLVSAHHVFENEQDYYCLLDIQGFIILKGEIMTYIPIGLMTKDTFEIYKPDIVYFKLPEGYLNLFKRAFVPFRSSSLLKEESVEFDRIFLFGFIISKTKHLVSMGKLLIGMDILQFEPNILDGNKLIVDKALTREDNSKLPELHGLSGSPVFCFTKKGLHILGVAKEYRKDKENNKLEVYFEPISLLNRFLHGKDEDEEVDFDIFWLPKWYLKLLSIPSKVGFCLPKIRLSPPRKPD